MVKWDLATGKEVTRYNTGATVPWGIQVWASRLVPDGRSIQAVTFQLKEDAMRGSARIETWDVDSGRVRTEKPLDGLTGGPLSLVKGISPDGRWGVGAMNFLFPLEEGQRTNLPNRVKGHMLVNPEFSWDSRLIALTAISDTREKQTARVIVLEVATGAKVFEIPVRWVTNFAFHPDGRSLVGAVPDGLVFWDLTTGKEYARSKAHSLDEDEAQPFAKVVRYFPDGKKLVTGLIDTTALIWESPDRPKNTNVLGEKERAAAWDDLMSPDGLKAWSAVWALADDPGAVAMLRGKVKPVESIPEKEKLRMIRAVAALELGRTPEARKLLTELASGVTEAVVTQEAKRALERERLSK
jgi:WD40 repeat protein